MRRFLLIALLVTVGVSATMTTPSYSWGYGGWGAGWFVGGARFRRCPRLHSNEAVLLLPARPRLRLPAARLRLPAAGLRLSAAGLHSAFAGVYLAAPAPRCRPPAAIGRGDDAEG